jgi:transketolase
MSSLKYIPLSELQRIQNLDISAEIVAELFSTCCRLNTLSMIMEAGSGHIGSSFSSLDVVSWLYLNELGADDIYFSSKGHDAPGLYSVLIALGTIGFDKIHTLRKLGGLPGHPDVSIPGMPTNTGSLGMGISKAKGMARANRLSGKSARVYVMTGDGELQEGQFWESLAGAVNEGISEITVIVDHNKLQSDIWVSQTSDLGDLEAKFSAFGWHVQTIDGHDFHAIDDSLKQARKETKRPSIIIADTIKGCGVSFMEHSVDRESRELYPYHSGAPTISEYDAASKELCDRIEKIVKNSVGHSIETFEKELPERVLLEKPQKLVNAYAEALVEQGRKNEKLIVFDADLKLDCGLIPFENEFPDRFVECGIAEQDMVSQAGGMALNGYLPVVHSFACFLTTRANEQIYNNATEKTKIIYCGSLAGLLPAGPGHSHQSVRDIDILAAVPGLDLIQPSCEQEVKMMVDYCFNTSQCSSYLRLTSIPYEIPFQLPENYIIQKGQGCLLREGKDILLIAYGPVMLSSAYRAAECLEKEDDVKVSVLNFPWLNTVNTVWFVNLLKQYSAVVTIDDHYVQGGQGEMLGSALAKLKSKLQIRHLGVEEIPHCGTNDEVLLSHSLDVTNIRNEIRDIVNK